MGNDISSTQIAVAKVRLAGKSNVELGEGDMLALDLADSSFDAVFGIYGIIHLKREDQKR